MHAAGARAGGRRVGSARTAGAGVTTARQRVSVGMPSVTAVALVAHGGGGGGRRRRAYGGRVGGRRTVSCNGGLYGAAQYVICTALATTARKLQRRRARATAGNGVKCRRVGRRLTTYGRLRGVGGHKHGVTAARLYGGVIMMVGCQLYSYALCLCGGCQLCQRSTTMVVSVRVDGARQRSGAVRSAYGHGGLTVGQRRLMSSAHDKRTRDSKRPGQHSTAHGARTAAAARRTPSGQHGVRGRATIGVGLTVATAVRSTAGHRSTTTVVSGLQLRLM